MARTINQGFTELQSRLEISSLQSSTVSTRQTNVRDAIKNDLTTLDDFLTGSYKRNTMIAPLAGADVDVFIVLDTKYFDQGGQAALLDRVKRVLLKTYTRTPDISRNGQAVTIRFDDFTVDVVPAFYRKGGGYLIPNSVTASWIETDPKKHIEIWAQANKTHGGKLVPLMKLLKSWNRSHSQLLTSFHLECLVLQVLTNVRIDSFPSAARYFFDKAHGLIDLKNLDPAGYGGDVGAYLNTTTKRDAVKDRLERAYNRAVEAESFEKNGRTADAFGRWRLIFDDFPAYG